MLRFLFGDDLFISYSRQDAIRYAEGLAAEMAGRGYSCRLDQWGSEPGEQMPESLIRGLRRATMLVIVGTPGSAKSPHVEQEIHEFVRTRRPIIPIDVYGSVEGACWFGSIQGLVLEVESAPEALERGQPSATVLDRIENSYTYTRRNARIQRTFWSTLAAVALMLAVGGTFLWTLRGQVTEVEAERNKLGLEIEAKNTELGEVQDDLQQRAREVTAARQSLVAAQSDLSEAQSGLETAQTDLGETRELERQARAAADRQERVAESRRLASLGESLFEREGPRVTALLAVEALGRSPTPEAYRVLTRALSLLPLPERRLELPPEAPRKPILDLAFSPDGSRCAALVRASDGGVMLWDLATGEATWQPLRGVKSIAFSSAGRFLIALGSEVHLLDGKTAAPIDFRLESTARSNNLHGALAPDERSIALARGTGEIEIRSIPDGELQTTLRIPGGSNSDPFRGLAYSPDGRWLAAGWRNQLYQWATAGWQRRPEWDLAGGLREMAMDPRSESVAIATGGALALLLLGETEESPSEGDRTLGGVSTVHPDQHLGVHFSRNGERFVARHVRNGDARVWSRDGSPLPATLPSGGVTDARLSPDGHRLALARGAQSYLWSLDRDEILYRFPYGEQVRFAPRGERLASTGTDGEVRLWRPERAWPLAEVGLAEDRQSDAIDIRFSPTTEHATVKQGAAARVWSRGRGVVSRLDLDAANAVSLSRDGRFVAVDVGEATLIHDVADPSSIVRLEVAESLDWQAIREHESRKGYSRVIPPLLDRWEASGSTKTLAFSPRSSLVATLRADDLLRVWQLPAGLEIRRWPFVWLDSLSAVGSESRAKAIFSADESVLAVMTKDSVAVWDVRTGEARPVSGLEGRPRRIALSHDGSRLATGSSDSTSIYDTTADRLEHKLTVGDIAEALIFAPDRTVALDGTRSFDRRAAARIDWQRDPAAAARAWFRPQASSLALISPDGPELADLGDPRSTRLFPNEATVTGVAVSLDGEFFATASVADVRVYSSRSGEELARIPGGGQQPRFGPAGDLLALQADDRVPVYRWKREALVEEACRRVVANLSCSEWERYVGSRDCHAICANLPPPERQVDESN